MMRWTAALSFVFVALIPHAQSQTASTERSSEVVAPASVGLSADPLAAMEKAIRAGEFKKIGSVLIARHGKLAYEAHVDGEVSTLRDTRSATKSITDILIGIAIGERKLSGVDARVLSYLPERAKKMQNPDPRKDKITLEDFLTMSSPLECDDWNDASRGNEERMYVVEDWTQFILDLPVRGRMHVGESIEPPPYGRDFSYCTGGVFTLSEVLAKATGTRTDRYAQEKLFGPLGIADSIWVYSPLNVPQTGGGLAPHQSRPPEDRGTLPHRRHLGREAYRRRRLGEGLDHAACPHRRRHRIRLPVVVKEFQIGGEELCCLLHERQRRQQGNGVSGPRHERRAH